MKLDIIIIEQLINYTFNNKKLLERAFTHSSMKKYDNNIENYERMEYLGDAILDFVVAEYLYLYRGNLSEGQMTTLRAKLVSRTPLSEVIYNLGNDKNNFNGEGIARYMQFGNGNYKFMLNDKIRGDLFEAIVAGIYLDGGIENAKRFILDNLRDILISNFDCDAKDDRSKLQEYCAKKGLDCFFTDVTEYGTINENVFVYEVYINKIFYGSGSASSKKLAQQFASKDAIQKLKAEGNFD